MAKILCLETATTNCSVALAIDGRISVVKEDFSETYSHSERLHCYIEEVLDRAGTKLNRLDAIAVSKGPGSFTGLRIGVSAAKGLCVALDIPLIATDTLESIACQVKDEYCKIVPMLDARRMEVYSAVYDGKKKLLRKIKAEILTDKSFEELDKNEKVYFIGNGSGKYKTICPFDQAVFMENNLPSANEMAFLAEDKYNQGQFEDVAYFEPYYLKDFILG